MFLNKSKSTFRGSKSQFASPWKSEHFHGTYTEKLSDTFFFFSLPRSFPTSLSDHSPPPSQGPMPLLLSRERTKQNKTKNLFLSSYHSQFLPSSLPFSPSLFLSSSLFLLTLSLMHKPKSSRVDFNLPRAHKKPIKRTCPHQSSCTVSTVPKLNSENCQYHSRPENFPFIIRRHHLIISDCFLFLSICGTFFRWFTILELLAQCFLQALRWSIFIKNLAWQCARWV